MKERVRREGEWGKEGGREGEVCTLRVASISPPMVK